MDGSPARTQAGRQSRSAFLYRLAPLHEIGIPLPAFGTAQQARPIGNGHSGKSARTVTAMLGIRRTKRNGRLVVLQTQKLTFVRADSTAHKQLVEQNAVGNGGFSIRFRRRGLPHSGSSCCHLAKSAPSDNREPTIRRSASGLCAGGKYTRSLERRTAPLPAVPVRQIPIAAFACVHREQGR
jgi:hypothetical protein